MTVYRPLMNSTTEGLERARHQAERYANDAEDYLLSGRRSLRRSARGVAQERMWKDFDDDGVSASIAEARDFAEAATEELDYRIRLLYGRWM